MGVVLSVKVPDELAERFREEARDNDLTPGALLRQFVECVAGWRRFEIFDPAVGGPAGWVFLHPGWRFDE